MRCSAEYAALTAPVPGNIHVRANKINRLMPVITYLKLTVYNKVVLKYFKRPRHISRVDLVKYLFTLNINI